MSDDDDDEVSDSDDEDDEESDAKSGDSEEQTKKVKDLAVQDDIAILGDVFKYCERVAGRAAAKVAAESQLQHALAETVSLKERIKELEIALAEKTYVLNGEEEEEEESVNQDISWSEYEGLDEGQRASLLERAIRVLTDEDAGRRHVKSGGAVRRSDQQSRTSKSFK